MPRKSWTGPARCNSRLPASRKRAGGQCGDHSCFDRILAAKQRDASADTSALEREIDELVYALYGLTPEEIKIVEDAGK